MKLVSFLYHNEERTGIYYNNKIFDLEESGKSLNLSLPVKMSDFLNGGTETSLLARKINNALIQGKIVSPLNEKDYSMLAPVPHPPSCRDAYAFRQHVAAARRNRGVEMIPEFDEFPVFYFTNHNTIYGEGDIPVENDHLRNLDFELESAIVIGKKGKNILAKDADNNIAGFMVMNDLSARLLQMDEMKMNLGPAKGKDFATSIGPWLVTPDELEEDVIKTDFGNKYNLRMTAVHNGKLVSDGNMKDMNWTFAEIIERASYGVELFPGDVIGSGTVGTGCYLELNGTAALEAKTKGESFSPVWLNNGDSIELEISKLGRLKNRIVKTNNDISILAKKKNIK
jgi:fumarylacetoacetate (FAA) hydrolase